MPLPSVAIAGATGRLGRHIVAAFLSPDFSPYFSEIRLLTRQESDQTKNWAQNGATVVICNEDHVDEALKDVDVVINAVGSSGSAFKAKLAQALVSSSAQLYFPSEFGVDHSVHDFPHKEWDAKTAHCELVHQRAPTLKICRVYPGLFLEDSIGPWFGFDTKAGRYEAIGSPEQQISFTSKVDVGKVVATLAAMKFSQVPEEIRLAGDSASMKEIAGIMEGAGAGKIEVVGIPYEEYRAEVLKDPNANAGKCLRFLMSEGKIDHSTKGMGNGNEMVNPGEARWKWITLKDLARDMGGKPWST